MIGSLTNFDQLGTVQNFGSMKYIAARYKDDNKIEQTGISLTEIGNTLACLNCLFVTLDNGGNPHIVQGTASCKVASITPDKDDAGSQLETGSLTYTNLVFSCPSIPHPASPPIVWINPMNEWGWALPFAGGG